MRKFIILLFALISMSAIAQTTKIYDMAEQMPSYAAGDRALMEYLQQAIVYPEDARAQQTQGRVIVRFVVELDGSLSHFEIMRSPGLRSMENEAIRVLNDMKDETWKPAMQNGQPVRCYYTQTITFRL